MTTRIYAYACLGTLLLTGCSFSGTQWGDRVGWTKPAETWPLPTPLPPQVTGWWTVTQLTALLRDTTHLAPVTDDAWLEIRTAPLTWPDLLADLRAAHWAPSQATWRRIDADHPYTLAPRQIAFCEWRITNAQAGTDFETVTANTSLAQGEMTIPDGDTETESTQTTRILSAPVFSGTSGTAIATTQNTATAGLTATLKVNRLDNGAYSVAGNLQSSAFTGSSGGGTGSQTLPLDADVPAERWVPIAAITDDAAGISILPRDWTISGNFSAATAILWVRVRPLK